MLDTEIRELLFDYIDEKYDKLRIYEELKIRKSIADIIIVLEDKLIGIEIKSDSDTYTRLPTQIKDYNHFFDYNYLAIGSSHIKHAHEHIPKHWGILCVETKNNIKPYITELRQPQPTPRLQVSYQIKLLWRLELNNILYKHKLPKYRQKSKRFVQLKLLEKLTPEELKTDICDELFERDYTMLYWLICYDNIYKFKHIVKISIILYENV